MTSARPRRTVAVVGLGAAGTLVAIRICGAAARDRVPVDLVLVDPAAEAGRGVAYSTPDPRHRLNVPAGNMSCHPDDPDHFVRWLLRRDGPAAGGTTRAAAAFAERHRYGAYLAETLDRAAAAALGTVTVRQYRTRVTDCRWSGGDGAENARLELADGRTVDADGVVLATGPAPAVPAWAPAALRDSVRFVADPWSPGALEGARGRAPDGRGTDDVLLVGSGLTAVDVALLLDLPTRTVHAVSRNGRLPRAHTAAPQPDVACPEPLQGLPLPAMRTAVRRHIGRVLRSHGDWRPAVDGLRPVTAELWASLTAEEQAEFVERDGSLWNVHRHRMAPAAAETVARMRRSRQLHLHRGRVTAARPGADGSLVVSLTDGRELTVGWVVDCTGPTRSLSQTADPLWRALLTRGSVVPGPLDMGVATDAGRLRAADGRTTRAMWTLGTPRRGELWETTAIPEIRDQAAAIAEAVLREPSRT